MASRDKTVRFPVNFDNVTDVADNTLTTLDTVTVYHPETIGSIQAFLVYFGWQSTASNASINSFASTLTINGSGNTNTVASTLAQTGEEISGIIGPVDFTDHFKNTYTSTGTSTNVRVAVQIDVSAGVNRGVYSYVEFTYVYDDTSPTQQQTICFPFEFSGSLATTQTTVVNLPQLTNAGGLLKDYSDIVIRNRWVHIKGNSNTNNATNDITLSFSFDSVGGGTSLPIKEEGGGSDGWVEYLIDSSALSATAGHTFQLWSNVATRFTNIIISEWFTYEFTTSGTTSCVNYFEYPIEFTWPLQTTSANFSRYGRTIIIPEPGTIVMESCAVEFIYNTNASATPSIRVGTQSFSNYAMAATQVVGCFGFQHRFDDGSDAGTGVTLTNGVNIINVDVYEVAGDISNMTGTVKLLYSSSVSSKGIGAHSRTVIRPLGTVDFTSKTAYLDNGIFLSITSGNWWIHGAGYQAHIFTQSTGQFQSLLVKLFSGEYSGDGYLTAFSDWYLGDNELTYFYWNICVCPFLKLYPQEPENFVDPTQSRDFLSNSTSTQRQGSRLFTSLHNITFTLSGNITGSNGGEVKLNLYKQSDTDEFDLYQVSAVTGNTSYSFEVYDDTATYQVVAYESTTKKGTSKRATYGTDFDIKLSNEYGYGYT